MFQLDVLVLATSYISHLSHLLEEDNLRVFHDSNNNTTAPAAVSTGLEQSVHNSKSETTARGPQKGLLHPVKVRQSKDTSRWDVSDALCLEDWPGSKHVC